MAACPSPKRLVFVLALVALTGCHAIDFYDTALQQPVPPEMEPARELSMVSLPTYRVEPPDILMIDMLRMVPLPPSRIEIYDALQIRAVGVLIDQPIGGYYLVEGDGAVALGPAYGRVQVAGMSIEQADAAVTKKLKETFARPEVSVQLANAASNTPITGEYLVGPDGAVNLRQYGTVHVSGKTVTQIRKDLNEHLRQFFDSPDVSVEVRQFNSKVFYVITEGGGIGDSVRRVPITGSDTVMDALSAVNGLSQVSSARVWIARPVPGGSDCVQVIPIDYAAITRGASTATNYQVMPGDRVYVACDTMIAVNSWVAKVIAPIDRLFGGVSLGATAAKGWQTLGREYNRTRQ
jgi:polysaccharide biosynthesis/export protein